MEKYGNLVAFTNISEIEKWEQEQKENIDKYSNFSIITKLHMYNGIKTVVNYLLTKWKSNPSWNLLVDEDELYCYISLAGRYMIEMYKFAESKNISNEDAEKSVQAAFLQMDKYSFDDLKKMYLMCNENIELMRRLMLFLSFECIDESIVSENLSNETPVPFIVDNNTDDFLSIPCDAELKNNSYDCGYRFEIKFDKDGKEKIDWMDYCKQQRESFEERYAEFVKSQKKCRL